MDTCILPVASYEQHGPYLPSDVDLVIATDLARRIAEKSSGIVLPPIPYSCSDEHSDFPLTVSIGYRTFSTYLEEVVHSLARQCGYVVVVNAHGGAAEFVQGVARTLNYRYGGRILVVDLWRRIAAMGLKGGHADTLETCLYMAAGGKPTSNMEHICEGDPVMLGFKRTAEMSRTGIVGCLDPDSIDVDMCSGLLDDIASYAVSLINNMRGPNTLKS